MADYIKTAIVKYDLQKSQYFLFQKWKYLSIQFYYTLEIFNILVTWFEPVSGYWGSCIPI